MKQIHSQGLSVAIYFVHFNDTSTNIYWSLLVDRTYQQDIPQQQELPEAGVFRPHGDETGHMHWTCIVTEDCNEAPRY